MTYSKPEIVLLGDAGELVQASDRVGGSEGITSATSYEVDE